MAISQVQKALYGSTAKQVDHSITITQPAQNNLIALCIVGDFTLAAVGSWTQTGWSKAVSAVSNTETGIWYRIAPAVFGTTVTFTLTGSGEAAACFYEYSGIDTASPLDRTASATGGSGTGTTSTTAQADELLLAALGAGSTNQTSNWSAWTNSFTEEADQPSNGATPNVSLGSAARIVAATGAYSTSATQATGATHEGAIATFKASGAAPPAVPGFGAATVGATAGTAIADATPGTVQADDAQGKVTVG